MRRQRSRRQRGVALIALLAVVALGASAYLMKQLNAESGGISAARKARNAEVLNRAKQALIGYVAMQAANSGEDNPGALPCPEAAGYFDNPAQDGQASGTCTLPKVGRFPWRTIGTDKLVDAAGEPLWYVVSPGWALTSGYTSINSNSIGQLTVDGAATTPVASPGNVNFTAHGFTAGDAVSFTTGGTLPTGMTAGTTYYVIATGLTANTFRIATVPAGAAINFTGASSGTHNVHRTPPGTANSIVALIIAPGPAFTVAANVASGCAARTQVRPLVATIDKWQDYLECGNANAPPNASSFVTKGPSDSFNDQVVIVTAGDIMPGVEAAIANRIEREIGPALKSMYNGGSWSGTTASPRLPYPAAFADPSSSAMLGASATCAGSACKGLLPMVYSETVPGSGVACTAGVSAPRCDPTLTTWSAPSMSGADTYSESCSIAGAQIDCTYYYRCSLLGCGAGTTPIAVSVAASNVGMAMRRLTPTAALDSLSMSNVVTPGRSLSGVLSATGSATITLDGSASHSGAGPLFANASCELIWPLTLILGCKQSTLSIPLALLQDHPILDPDDASYGWFVRNKWHEVAYYAVASGFVPDGAASCVDSTTCLTVAYHRNSANIVDDGKQRAILVLSGRSLTGATRPNGTLADWMEGANAAGASFETRSASLLNLRAFNDRIAVLDSNP